MEPIRVPRLQNESNTEYIYRICSTKSENNWTWNNVRDIINTELGYNYSESYYRKNYKNCSYKIMETSEDSNSELVDKLAEIRKERMKLSDERAQNNAILRRLDREDTLIEIAKQVSKHLSGKKLLHTSFNTPTRKGKKKAILELSDWHYGIEINNPWNIYNPNIAKERITQLLNVVMHKCESNDVDEIWVVNLGDLISGRIHDTIRIQNRIDVITQIIEVTEILMEFMAKLVASGYKVNYVSCNDNHSRLEPKKESSLDLESLTRITDWVFKLTIGNKVTIIENKFGHDIATFDIFDFKIVAVHGHKDTPKNIVPNMSLVTHTYYNLALTAHLHHFSCDEQNETVIVSNGSLMGVDDYAQTLRLTSRPSQNLIICNPAAVIDSIHRIVLD